MSPIRAVFPFLVAACLVPVRAIPAEAEAEAAVADVVTLRDGRTVLGEVRDVSGRSLTMVVRRDWAGRNVPDWRTRWEVSEKAVTGRAGVQRRERLLAWKRDRTSPPAVSPAVDRIGPWIDRELARLGAGVGNEPTPLMRVRLNSSDYTKLVRRPRETDGLLREAWKSRLPDPESKSADELKDALEARGFDLSRPLVGTIESLLPLEPETDSAWMLRRAATEVAHDPNLRFLMHQGMLLVEPGNGGGNPGMPALQALPALGALLGGQPPGDQLAGRLRMLAGWGRVGALVTRLEIAPDFSAVQVEITMMVRPGSSTDRWQSAGNRTARVRPDDLGPDAGKDLAADPQVAAAFRLIEAVGLRELAPELKRRSLAVGAATSRALGRARADAEADLARLALPVLDAPAVVEPPPAPPGR